MVSDCSSSWSLRTCNFYCADPKGQGPITVIFSSFFRNNLLTKQNGGMLLDSNGAMGRKVSSPKPKTLSDILLLLLMKILKQFGPLDNLNHKT